MRVSELGWMTVGRLQLWNTMPVSLHLVDDYTHFKRLVKARLFAGDRGTALTFLGTVCKYFYLPVDVRGSRSGV